MSSRIGLSLLFLACGVYSQGNPKFKIGAGMLNGFGGIGVGLEAELYQAALLAGLGTLGADKPAWDIGLRYYLRPVGKKLRPHATASYGPTHLIEYGPISNPNENIALIFGFTFLAGLDHDFKKPGGFMMTYGIGVGLAGDFPKDVKDDYQAAGQPLPSKPGPAATGSLGIKYQF